MPDLVAPFESKTALLALLKAPKEPVGGEAIVGNSRWSNKDLEPTAKDQRTWTWYNLPLYWFSNMFGTAGWTAASSLIAVGLVSTLPRRHSLLHIQD